MFNDDDVDMFSMSGFEDDFSVVMEDDYDDFADDEESDEYGDDFEDDLLEDDASVDDDYTDEDDYDNHEAEDGYTRESFDYDKFYGIEDEIEEDSDPADMDDDM